MEFDITQTLKLISALTEQKSALMQEFYIYIEYDNLIFNKEYLESITPIEFKTNHQDMNYFDLFYEISSRLDFISTFTLKEAIEIYLEIKHVERTKLVTDTFFTI
jgi:hypothetical protein